MSCEEFLCPGGAYSAGHVIDGWWVLLTSVNIIKFCEVSKSIVSYVVDPCVSRRFLVVAWL
jgi:hypothetical protein